MIVYNILSYLNPILTIFVLLPITVIAASMVFKLIMDGNAKKVLAGAPVANASDTSKKYAIADIYQHSPIAAGVGLSLTVLTMIAVFEFPTFEEQALVDLGVGTNADEEQLEIPPETEQKPPPPPVIQQPEIIEVPDEEEIEEDIKVELDAESDENSVIEEQVEFDLGEVDAPPPAEDVNKVFTFVEDGAAFPGGEPEMQKFIKKNFRYPRAARRLGVEGRVFISFVVERDGSITDVTVARGVHELLDNEAKRVVEAMPHWKPGKQRGKPVRLRMTVPIVARLR